MKFLIFLIFIILLNFSFISSQEVECQGAVLRILNKSIKNQKEKNIFEPFVLFEDDVKKYRDFPENIEIPDECDLLYIGLSKWGITTNPNQGVENSVKYTNINKKIAPSVIEKNKVST